MWSPPSLNVESYMEPQRSPGSGVVAHRPVNKPGRDLPIGDISKSGTTSLGLLPKTPRLTMGDATTMLVSDTGAWNSGVFAGLSSQRPRVQIPSLPRIQHLGAGEI